AAKDKEADELRKKAAGQPPGSPEARQAREKAAEADELRRAADRAAAEAEALRNAIKAAGGQALPDELRRAADAMRNNRPREAADRMEAARDELEQGRAPTREQAEAVDNLDAARDRLDAADRSARELSDEKRRKLFDQVKALSGRHQAAAAEAARIQEKVLR